MVYLLTGFGLLFLISNESISYIFSATNKKKKQTHKKDDGCILYLSFKHHLSISSTELYLRFSLSLSLSAQ